MRFVFYSASASNTRAVHAQEAGPKPMRRRNEAAYTSGMRSMRERAAFAGLVAGVSVQLCGAGFARIYRATASRVLIKRKPDRFDKF